MKTTKILNVIAGVLIAVASLAAVGRSAHAAGVQPLVQTDYCDVTSQVWAMAGSTGGLTLPYAAFAVANHGDPNLYGCKKGINIKVPSIKMLGPISFYADMLGASAANPYVIDGGGVVLDAALVATNKQAKSKCVVLISGQYVTVKNLTINSVPSGYDAVCMVKDSGRIENVTTRGGDNGVSFGNTTDAINNVIAAPTNIKSASLFAINFGDESDNVVGSRNILQPLALAAGTTLDDTDADGLQLPPAGAGRLLIEGSIDKFFYSKSQTQVCVKVGLPAEDPDKIFVRGWVVESSKDLPASDASEADFGFSTKVKRLQIYNGTGFYGYVGAMPDGGDMGMGSNQTTGTGEYLGDTGYFAFNIPKSAGRFTLVPEGTDGRVGRPMMPPRDASSGPGPCNSWERGDDGLHEAGTAGNGGGNGGSGGAGKLKHIKSTGFVSIRECLANINITTGRRPKAFNPKFDTDGDSIQDDDEDINLDCSCDPGETCWYKPDTDTDGVPDGAEALPPKGCLTYDKTTNVIQLAKTAICDNTKFTGGVTPWNHYTVKGAPQVNCGSPSHICYDAVNNDSDGDGKIDGMEDRNQALAAMVSVNGNWTTPSYLYWFDNAVSSGQRYPNVAKNGPIPCDQTDPQGKSLGIQYNMYMMCTGSDPKMLEGGQLLTDLPAGFDASKCDIHVLACKNSSLASPENFDGKYSSATGNGELNPFKRDTDGDQFCDGPSCGSDCGTDGVDDDILGKGLQTKSCNPKSEQDKCPTITDLNNDCKGDAPCSDGMIFFTVSPDYVVWDQNGQPNGLRMDGKIRTLLQDKDGKFVVGEKDATDGTKGKDANIADIFELPCDEIAKFAADTDGDGIPDIIESPNGKCDPKLNETGLKPNNSDSDGDLFIDGRGKNNVVPPGYKGEDVCPMVGNTSATDGFVAGKTSYSCGSSLDQVRKIYVNPANNSTLACFFDRDGDGLTDAQEDVNRNGSVDKVGHIKSYITDDIMATIETDPLMQDTDGDSLNDQFEKAKAVKQESGKGVYTNPQDPDTDGDTIMDGDENRDGVPGFQLGQSDANGKEDNITGQDGCANAVTVDTDPTEKDTDGDGLADNAELSWDATKRATGGAIQKGYITTPPAGVGVPSISNPRSGDSDGDGLLDSQEYAGGFIRQYDSNPCMHDADNDTVWDKDEKIGCALNKDQSCAGSGQMQSDGKTPKTMKDKPANATSADIDTSNGTDGDGDGLPDWCQTKLGLPAGQKDADGDNLHNGEEIQWAMYHDCAVLPLRGDTNPLDGDTEHDGLNDGMEKAYGTNPNKADTDGDCIPDGPSNITDSTGAKVWSFGEIHQPDFGGKLTASDTDANNPDTDGDGLPDGNVTGTGEDMNCNGVRDQKADATWAETDPRLPDSNFDGTNDKDAMYSGGYFNLANIDHATQADHGCSLVAGAGGSSGSIISLAALLAGLVPMVARRRRG
ncbi:MAG: hypothetical protein V2A66_02175 [Pseudomonadota bacterium]